MNYVVPGLIREDTIFWLPVEVLAELANISSEIVVNYVNIYCDKNKNSNEDMTSTCVRKLEAAYASINAKKKYLKSRTARDIVDTLSSLSYVDIYYQGDATLKQLEEYKFCIEAVLDNNKEYGKARVVTNADWENFQRFCEGFIKRSVYEIEEERLQAVEAIKKIVKYNKSMFKSAPFSISDSTIFTRFLNKKETLETLRYGITFLMDNINKGAKPESWRYL